MEDEKELLPLCACGCGESVAKKGNRFILGHSGGRGSRITPKPEPKLCNCGCGELANPGRDYINGHNLRGQEHPRGMLGKKASPETRLLMSKAAKRIIKSPEHIAAIAKSLKGRVISEETRKLISETQKANPQTGDTIVGHHVAYDFKRPKTLIVKVTRKFHAQIHNPKGCQFGNRGYSLID